MFQTLPGVYAKKQARHDVQRQPIFILDADNIGHEIQIQNDDK